MDSKVLILSWLTKQQGHHRWKLQIQVNAVMLYTSTERGNLSVKKYHLLLPKSALAKHQKATEKHHALVW